MAKAGCCVSTPLDSTHTSLEEPNHDTTSALGRDLSGGYVPASRAPRRDRSHTPSQPTNTPASQPTVHLPDKPPPLTPEAAAALLDFLLREHTEYAEHAAQAVPAEQPARHDPNQRLALHRDSTVRRTTTTRPARTVPTGSRPCRP